MVAPNTLLTNATATITFDGLMLLVYDPAARVCQVGVHTRAEKHELAITVNEAAKPDPDDKEWPQEGEWSGSHENVSAIAPLWLYVDSGNGRRPEEFSASLFQPGDTHFSQSFGNVLDFEGTLYARKLDYIPDAFSLLNVASGLFYSHDNVRAELKRFDQNQPHSEAQHFRDLVVCSVAAADIDAVSEEAGANGEAAVERFIVLEQENPKKVLFRRKLEKGKHYFIKLVNGPVLDGPHPGHGAGHASAGEHGAHGGAGATTMSHAEHFLQFYELFKINPDEKKFLVDLPKTGNESPSAPPCNVGRGGTSSSFS